MDMNTMLRRWLRVITVCINDGFAAPDKSFPYSSNGRWHAAQVTVKKHLLHMFNYYQST